MEPGRPREYDRVAIGLAFEEYVANTEIPIAAEFASQQGLTRQFVYDCPELSDVLKRCTSKKEAALERQALNGKVNCTMAIFSLKQLGWSDRNEQTLKGDATAPVALKLIGSDIHG